MVAHAFIHHRQTSLLVVTGVIGLLPDLADRITASLNGEWTDRISAARKGLMTAADKVVISPCPEYDTPIATAILATSLMTKKTMQLDYFRKNANAILSTPESMLEVRDDILPAMVLLLKSASTFWLAIDQLKNNGRTAIIIEDRFARAMKSLLGRNRAVHMWVKWLRANSYQTGIHTLVIRDEFRSIIMPEDILVAT